MPPSPLVNVRYVATFYLSNYHVTDLIEMRSHENCLLVELFSLVSSHRVKQHSWNSCSVTDFIELQCIVIYCNCIVSGWR